MTTTVLGVVVSLVTAQASPKVWHLTVLGGSAALLHGCIEMFRQRQSVDEVRKAERDTTAVVLEELSTALSKMLKNSADIDEYGRTVLNRLHTVFGDRGPVRIFFLRYHWGDNKNKMAVTNSNQEGKIAFKSCWPHGHQKDISWEINREDAMAKTGEQIMARREPWIRPLVVDDVNKPEFQQEQGGGAVLQSPNSDTSRTSRVVSYCRAAVTHEDKNLGILCVDCWKKEALTYEDRTVIELFAKLLAVGLSISKIPDRVIPS